MYQHRKPLDKDAYIFGLRPTIEAIQAGKEIDKILIQTGLSGSIAHELKTVLRDTQIPVQYVPQEKLNRITNKNHQGIICYVSQITYQSIEDIVPTLFEDGKTPLILILDRITDVRNFGAIARTAECSGVDAIVIPARGGAQINADAVKTSAGALHIVPVCREDNLKDTIEYLKNSGIQIIACTEKTDDYHYNVNMTGPTAIIVGSEEDGISPEYLKRCDGKAKLPLMGTIGSLNVSVASGVILYEVLRQRGLK